MSAQYAIHASMVTYLIAFLTRSIPVANMVSMKRECTSQCILPDLELDRRLVLQGHSLGQEGSLCGSAHESL